MQACLSTTWKLCFDPRLWPLPLGARRPWDRWAVWSQFKRRYTESFLSLRKAGYILLFPYDHRTLGEILTPWGCQSELGSTCPFRFMAQELGTGSEGGRLLMLQGRSLRSSSGNHVGTEQVFMCSPGNLFLLVRVAAGQHLKKITAYGVLLSAYI